MSLGRTATGAEGAKLTVWRAAEEPWGHDWWELGTNNPASTSTTNEFQTQKSEQTASEIICHVAYAGKKNLTDKKT